jgi:hypothetical protein
MFKLTLPWGKMSLLAGVTVIGILAGPAVPAAQSCNSNMTITSVVVNNSQTTLVGDTMDVSVAVTSACSIQSVVAAAFGRTVVLSYTGITSNRWVGSFSLTNDPRGPFSLIITATDGTGASATRTVDLIRDTLPVVSVTLPENNAVARPSIRLSATCADDDSAGCQSLKVATADGNIIASGTTRIETDVSLAVYEGRKITLEYRGTDSRGQTGSIYRVVFVESNPRLIEYARAPGSLILDDSADNLLVFKDDCCPTLVQKASGQTTQLSAWGPNTAQRRPHGHVTSRGAIFPNYPTSTSHTSDSQVLELRDGVLTNLGYH